MGNKMTSLPSDVDSFLMDLAQMYEGLESLDYSDIQTFANHATASDVNDIRELMYEASELDFDLEEPEVEEIYNTIISHIKTVTV
jgi:hypothetical protein